MAENVKIRNFVKCMMSKDLAEAKKHLTQAVQEKIEAKEQEIKNGDK